MVMYHSSKFIRYLDSYCNKQDIMKTECDNLMMNIKHNFNGIYGISSNLYDSKKSTKQNKNKGSPTSCSSYPTLSTNISQINSIAKHHKITIETDVNNLDDLLNIIRSYEYNVDTEYNIDLKSLHNIKDELTALNAMIGMENIKTSITNQLLYFIQNLDKDALGNSDFKHTVISGPPGTGKTEIAKLIGTMYSKVGILKNNVFKKVTRSDLIAGYLGQTAIKTSKLITECLGGVLFIDEAYSLASTDSNDSFSKECLDTLCESLSNHKNDLMVIIAGYEHDLNNTFFKVNRGLESRFIWKFCMEPYTSDELMRIFMKKVLDSGWHMNIETTSLRTWFARNHRKFIHYGRDMEQLFTYVKIYHSRRIYGKDISMRKHIILDDMASAFESFETSRNKDKLPNYLQNIYV